MPREPQTNEEYIEQVAEQARKQEGESVKTHQQILQEYNQTKQNYQHKTQFFFFLLVALLVAYVAANHWQNIQQALGNASL